LVADGNTCVGGGFSRPAEDAVGQVLKGEVRFRRHRHERTWDRGAGRTHDMLPRVASAGSQPKVRRSARGSSKLQLPKERRYWRAARTWAVEARRSRQRRPSSSKAK